MAYQKRPERGSDSFSYEIVQSVGVIDTNEKSGWTTEVNLIKWGDYAPKFDIRAWSPDHQKMGKGVGLNKDQLKNLRDLLNTMELD